MYIYVFTDIDQCVSSPCQNSGTCRPLTNDGYSCLCTDAFYGLNCEYERIPEEPEEQSMVMVILIVVLAVLIVSVVIIACIICKRKRMGEGSDSEMKKAVSSGTISQRTTVTDNTSMGTGSATQWYPSYAQYSQKGSPSTALLLVQQQQQQV